MLFFALKKNSINDATIKSPKSVSSQRSLTVFLEAEKNMFDHLKAFITLSFFLRGCPACFLILKGVVISSHETNRFS